MRLERTRADSSRMLNISAHKHTRRHELTHTQLSPGAAKRVRDGKGRESERNIREKSTRDREGKGGGRVGKKRERERETYL